MIDRSALLDINRKIATMGDERERLGKMAKVVKSHRKTDQD
jgi:hypothetical protein